METVSAVLKCASETSRGFFKKLPSVTVGTSRAVERSQALWKVYGQFSFGSGGLLRGCGVSGWGVWGGLGVGVWGLLQLAFLKDTDRLSPHQCIQIKQC